MKSRASMKASERNISRETLCRDGGAAREAFDHRAQNHEAVGRTETGFLGAFRVQHQPDDIAFAVADACDGCERAIWVRVFCQRTLPGRITQSRIPPIHVNIPKNYLLVAFEFGERPRIAEVVP